MSKDPKNAINMESLWFYFDAIERDCMDIGMLDRKSTQVQVLKGKLMRLPKAEFDAAIKTIERLVDSKEGVQDEKRHAEQQRKRASVELFEKTAAVSESKPLVDGVSRVT